MEYDKQITNRLKRIEGQLCGVIKMMDEQKECRDVVTQLAACRNAIDRTIGLIVSKNLEHCIRTNIEQGKDTEELVKEAIDLLVKSR